MGYPDVAGFRLGTCRPVRWFDPVKRQLTNLTLHPLTVMDCTLDRNEYMGLDEVGAFEPVKLLADMTSRQNDELVCLWHDTSLAAYDTGYHQLLYSRVLEYLRMMLSKESVALEI